MVVKFSFLLSMSVVIRETRKANGLVMYVLFYYVYSHIAVLMAKLSSTSVRILSLGTAMCNGDCVQMVYATPVRPYD